MLTTSQLGTLASLKVLKKLETDLNIDLTPVSNQLTAIETKVDGIPTTDLTGVSTQLSTIEGKIDQIPVTDLTEVNFKLDQLLSIPTQSGIVFTPLILQPTYETYSSYGWLSAPSDLNLIFDGDENTGTNFFQNISAQYSYGWLKINAGITIPQFTKIQIKMGIKNSNNNKSLFEWSTGIGSAVTPFWADFQDRSASETIVNIENLIIGTWEYLRLRLYEMVTWPPSAKIYSIKVWKVE